MNKILSAVVVILIAITGIQQYRITSLKTEVSTQSIKLATNLAASPAQSVPRQVSSDRDSESETAFESNPGEISTTSKLVARAGTKAVVPEGTGSTRGATDKTAAKKGAPKPEAVLQREAAIRVRKQVAEATKAYNDGDHETALRLLRDTMAENPGDPQAFSALAKLYRDLGMVDDAIRTYNDWTATRPEDAQAFLAQAALYEALGMNAESVQSLARYEEIKQGTPDSYSTAAAMYRRLGMPQEELTAILGWVDSAPTSPQAYLALGEYYRRAGDTSSALAQYQQASSIAPGNVGAHLSMATAYQQLGDHASAQAALHTALQLHPGDASIYLRLADSYRRSGDLSAAIGAYESVLAMEPNSNSAIRASQQIVRLQRQLTAQRKTTG
ncbi:MAG TPA: tetratricopeptide repeat protein [Candidatus Hydrogenedentes bacterium]|nr:tetratricopeptide repeat protein [Candidatus Hydrogenedentota bacterium]